ncbi:MAG TPA: 23S rRNA (adenine(2503)-C(2))-methyltransferase RlmN [Acidimicrobiia bacterium]|nr:23S rRNA (adenine(2503)-C(2))-methyltransferase RlmN [Acidimicrobiia bacterium]
MYLHAPEDLGDLLTDQPSYRADQLREWLYTTPVLHATDMTNLPAALRETINDDHWPFDVEIEQSADRGTTRKWLFRAKDGAAIEAVLMGYPQRATLCISSQAGCALGCTFCATGQFGFDRHLKAGEIVAQVAYARAFLRQVGMPRVPDHLTNIVFMGMGEPLANFDRVREAIRRMIEVMGISARSITVSTVGLVPGIRRLAAEPWPVYLAVSLHAADDELRTSLVPINKRYPIAELEKAAREYFEKKRRRISIEWTMMEGVNDTLDQADKLSGIARRLGAHVNLIPLNPTPLSAERAPSELAISEFADALKKRGVNVTVRDTRGRDIDAACGQLRVLSESGGRTSRVEIGSQPE